MDTKTQLIEVLILFALLGISFFNMPSSEQSPTRKTFCGVICTIAILYTAYFFLKLLLGDFFYVNSSWVFSGERILNFVSESIEYIFFLIIGIVAWIWLVEVCHNRK